MAAIIKAGQRAAGATPAKVGAPPGQAPARAAQGARAAPAAVPATYETSAAPRGTRLDAAPARHQPPAARAMDYPGIQGTSAAEALPLADIDALAAQLAGSPDALSPVAWRARSAEFGLPGLDLPKDVGGRGFSAEQMVQVFEHAGRISLNMRDMIGGAHVRPLLASSAPEVRSIVKDVAQGKGYVAIAITEKEAGSNMRAMQSQSVKVPGGYELTGAKMFNARLNNASHVVVFARSPEQDGKSTKLNAFVLPIDHPGLEVQTLGAHGLAANSFGGISFNKVFVPERLRIGGEGEGGKVFRDHFMYWRLMQAAAAIGTGKGALDQAAERLRTRQAFGGPIGRFTHFQQELAEHTSKLHMASLLLEEAARKIDAGDGKEASGLAAMAKAEGVEWALAAADFAMELFGAEGYSPDLSDLGQRVRDLQGLRIADGTTHILREEVVRHVYGEEFWDMAVGPQAPKGEGPGREEDLPRGAFEALRKALAQNPDALVYQGVYDDRIAPDGGGACPTVCAANLIQGLGVMHGSAPLVDLDQAINSAFRADPKLLEGRLTNAQVTDLLEYYRSNFLPDVKFDVKVDYQKSLETRAEPARSKGWTDMDSGVLEVRPHELKLLSYTWEQDGEVLGRHFVVLKAKQDNAITVVDPTNPVKDYQYDVQRVDLPDGGSSFSLTRAGTPDNGGRVFTLNTAITVTLREGDEPVARA